MGSALPSPLRYLAQIAIFMLFIAAPRAFAATVDVSKFGAKANDAISDTAAINAAIAAAKPGDTVNLGTGTYQLDSSLNLKTGVNLVGAGQASTFLKYVGTALHPLINGDSVSTISLSGFTLDGNSSTNAAQGIELSNSSALNIHALSVVNLVKNSDIGPHGIYCTTSVTNSVISGNTFNNIGVNSEWGAGIRLAWNSSSNKVIGNTITNTGRGGILCNDGSTDNAICNNTVSGSGGVGLGIEVQNCDRSLISGNKIDHWLSVDHSSGSAIRNNTVSDKTGLYKLCGLELVDSHDVSFTHNTVDGGAQVGISISGPNPKQRVFWGHNTINAANTWGTQIQGDSAAGIVSQQYFFANTFSNALDVATGGLYPHQGHGVRFNGNGHYITFDSNTIKNNQGEGMQIGGGNVDNLSLINNIITGNTQSAIDQDPMTDALWQGNTVTANGGNTTPPSNGTQPRPTVAIQAPQLISVGQSASFTANFHETGVTLGNVLWDFGDGLPATTTTATHTFALPGTYEVSLLAWDQTGYGAHAEMSVTVAPEPGTAATLVGAAALLLPRNRRKRNIPR